MLHILKHLKNDSYGVLIGNSKLINKDRGEIRVFNVVDSYALSHDKVLVPTLDIFLKMVDLKL